MKRLIALIAVLVALAASAAAMFDGADHAQPAAASWAGPDPDGWSWGDDPQ